MKQYRALLLFNAVFYLAEGIVLLVWRVAYPWSWFTFWTARLGLNF